ncbi:MAG: cupin domain-containing protein [Chloroflexota bacterium]
MPIDVRRFGVGHRRPDGPPGTTGIEGQVIESGPGGVIAELAFSRRARIAPHSNPRDAWFVVIEGGGWVGVGEERTRVSAGDAVAWPSGVVHAAWTDGAPMRAIVVEFSGPVLALPAVLEGAAAVLDGGVRPVARGEGSLAPLPYDPARHPRDPEAEEGEPA